MRLYALGFAFALLSPLTAHSAIVVYTDPAAFSAAISGRTSTTENFDSAAEGSLIDSGTSFSGITFDYAWGIESMRINSDNPTNSGTQYLGATNGGTGGTAVDLFTPNNTLTMTPDSPASALGLFLITAEPALDGDFTLSGGGALADLVTPPLSTLGTSEVYFLGLVEDTGAEITSFVLAADPILVLLPYRIDGITYASAVPEPSSMLLLSLTTLCIANKRSRKRTV